MDIINDPSTNPSIADAGAKWRAAFDAQVSAELAAAAAREAAVRARKVFEAALGEVGLSLVDLKPLGKPGKRATKAELAALDEDVREAIRGGRLATPKALASHLTGVSRSALRASLARIAGTWPAELRGP